jgi:hypothetical protein
MNKTEIEILLNSAHIAFWNSALALPNPTISINGKWSVAQNVAHINLTLSRLGQFLCLPKKDIEANFGLSNRASISNDEFIESYQKALTNGVQSPASFVPEFNLDSNIPELVAIGKNILESFISNLQNWSEEELEQYQCPHPALGKITVREMLYFTVFHVQYHDQIINRPK